MFNLFNVDYQCFALLQTEFYVDNFWLKTAVFLVFF